MPNDLRLAQLLCARLCHELGGPVGTVEGALGLLGAAAGPPGAAADAAEALEVAREGGEALRRRLRLYRAAWGGGVGDMGLPELRELLEGGVAGGRARLSTDGLPANAVLPAAQAQVVLNAVLLAGEALPRGGTVQLAGDPPRGIAVLPGGAGAAWPPGLAAALATGGLEPVSPAAAPPTPSARTVQAPFLAALAAALGVPLSLALGLGPGPGPLLVGAAPATPG
jgi:histidine phosphotransferase ChpT